jgi:hypothetical protein
VDGGHWLTVGDMRGLVGGWSGCVGWVSIELARLQRVSADQRCSVSADVSKEVMLALVPISCVEAYAA